MDDAISRQAVLDIIRFEDKWLLDAKGHNADTEIAFSGMKSKISDLPPVKPQANTGHWEQYGNSWEDKFKCSECGKEQCKILCGERIIGHWYDYCPNCGCRMIEPQESERV